LLTQVGETAINPIHKSTCHCGSVELELQLPDGIVDPRRCNCSICRRKGAVVGSVPLSGLKIVKGEDKLSLYQFPNLIEGVQLYDGANNHPSDKRAS
jgi:hypothetical protein